jgi:hypothetical protein
MLIGLALPPILDLGGGLELTAQAQQQLHLVVLPLLRRVALPRVQVLFRCKPSRVERANDLCALS